MKQTLVKQIAKAAAITILAASLTMTGLNATAPPAQAGILYGLCFSDCISVTDGSHEAVVACTLICRAVHA